MKRAQGRCPTCQLIFDASAEGLAPTTCPICDVELTFAESHVPPAQTAAAAPAPVATTPAASRPNLRGIATLGILLFLVGGTTLGVIWYRSIEQGNVRAAAPAALRPPGDDPPLDVERLPPRPTPAPPAPLRRPAAPVSRPAQIARAPEPLAIRVNRAIDRGVAYLKRTQQDDAAAGLGEVAPWRGPLAWRLAQRTPDEGLLGLTLLSCGVPARAPIIRRLATNLRQQAQQINKTYSLSLALLFFDRLHNPSDRLLIQSLALRLVAGQSGAGGWSYNCPSLNTQQEQLLRSYLWSGVAAVPDPPAPSGNRFDSPPSLLELALVRPGRRRQRRPIYFPPSDNSNTQFALLALWAARRHGAPVSPALVRVVRHLRTTQRSDGSWSYRVTDGRSRPSNSCAGLMGLAVEHGLRHWNDGRIRDAAMQKGLRFLGRTLTSARPNVSPKQRGFSGVEIQDDLYFFWSLERTAVVYGLRVIGKTEWYPWAAEKIVNAQEADGSWRNTFGGSVDTCFALLVLRRTNFASDLTAALRGRIPGQDPLPSAIRRPGGVPPLSTVRKPEEGAGSSSRKDPEELSGSAIEKAPPK